MEINLTENDIKKALPNVETGFKIYKNIQDNIRKSDLTKDKNLQRKFNYFYRLRLSEEKRKVVYRLIQRRESNYRKALKELGCATGRVEKSYASKVVATVDPKLPVVDSVVLRNIGASAVHTLEDAVFLYEEMQKLYRWFLSSKDGKILVRMFDGHFLNNQITNVKKLDFILWQMRD